MVMPSPTTFIYDLDGVLTDTTEFHYQSWQRLADEEGIPFNRASYDPMRGLSRGDSLALLLKDYHRALSDSEIAAWLKRKNDYFTAHLTDLRLLAGVEHLMIEARRRGIKQGLASSSQNARIVIDTLGITQQLDAIGDAFSVSRPKPAPDIFVWVAGALNVPPSQVVVFEDAAAGVQAAQDAGMFVVGLGPASRVGNAHINLPDLNGVQVTDILDALPAKP